MANKQKTMGRYYPYCSASLCLSCIYKDESCTWPGRDVARCPKYIQTAGLFDQVIGK